MFRVIGLLGLGFRDIALSVQGLGLQGFNGGESGNYY